MIMYIFLAGNRIKAMESRLFRYSSKLNHVNLMSNSCINGSFTDILDALSVIVDENCEKTDFELKPFCEVTGKCALGEKCCQLSKFKSLSRLEWKTLSFDHDFGFDAIWYNSNPNIEYLLAKISWTFGDIKVYDASNCAVREVFWINFRGLSMLETVNLSNNQFTAVVRELFDQMPLKKLDLCNYFQFGFG